MTMPLALNKSVRGQLEVKVQMCFRTEYSSIDKLPNKNKIRPLAKF